MIYFWSPKSRKKSVFFKKELKKSIKLIHYGFEDLMLFLYLFIFLKKKLYLKKTFFFAFKSVRGNKGNIERGCYKHFDKIVKKQWNQK